MAAIATAASSESTRATDACSARGAAIAPAPAGSPRVPVGAACGRARSSGSTARAPAMARRAIAASRRTASSTDEILDERAVCGADERRMATPRSYAQAVVDGRRMARCADSRERKLEKGRQGCPAGLRWCPRWTRLLLQPDDHRGAPVQTPRLFAGVVVLRPLLTVADRAQTVGARSPRDDEVVADGVGAALAERQVVFGRADVAGVAFDLDAAGVALSCIARIASSRMRTASGRSE